MRDACRGEGECPFAQREKQASLEFDLTFVDVLPHKLVQNY